MHAYEIKELHKRYSWIGPLSFINLANPIYFVEIKTKEFLRKIFDL